MIIVILATLFLSLALAEDFKTVSGKMYKDATISRVEPDGIVLRTKTGISKVYFVELPKDVQERFHYPPSTPVAAQREPELMKLEPKQKGTPQARGGWAAALAVPALFRTLLGFVIVGAVIVTGVLVFIIRGRM